MTANIVEPIIIPDVHSNVRKPTPSLRSQRLKRSRTADVGIAEVSSRRAPSLSPRKRWAGTDFDQLVIVSESPAKRPFEDDLDVCVVSSAKGKEKAKAPPPETCKICYDEFILRRRGDEKKGSRLRCGHTICNDCLEGLVSSKLEERKLADCPFCKEKIGPADVERKLDPKIVAELWTIELLEDPSMFFCPNAACSAAIAAPENTGNSNQEMKDRCPSCQTEICSRCRVKFHVGMTCQQWKALPDEEKNDESLRGLMAYAKEKKCQQCPKCKMMVEKSFGCNKMKCKCGTKFCYACGKKSDYGREGAKMLCGCVIHDAPPRIHGHYAQNGGGNAIAARQMAQAVFNPYDRRGYPWNYPPMPINAMYVGHIPAAPAPRPRQENRRGGHRNR